MTKTGFPMLLGAGLALLAGCSSVAARFVPDQNIDDPLKTQGESFLTRAVFTRAARSHQTVVFQGDKTSPTFPDRERPPVNPRGFVVEYDLRDSFTVAVPSGMLPPTIRINRISTELTLSDQGGARQVQAPATFFDVNLVLQQQSGGSTYAVSSGTLALAVDLGDKTGEAVDLLTSGGDNIAILKFTLDVVSEPDLPIGSTITLVVQRSAGTISFH